MVLLDFVCFDCAPVKFDCGESLNVDLVKNWCIREEESECKLNPLPPTCGIECFVDTKSDMLFLSHPDDFQFYFICLDGVSILTR